MTYYNEIDPYCCQWLKNLMAAGLIPEGEVDGRSIELVQPEDLRGFSQCHFFAGLGGWAYALRLAGWPDDRPIWTGSCPCQPFSVAGRRKGIEDPRHLWPHFYRVIGASRPVVVMGEQVAGKDGYAWLSGVGSDLEAEGYAWRAVDIPACGVGAPQIRNRIYWVAGPVEHRWQQGPDPLWKRQSIAPRGGEATLRLADSLGAGLAGRQGECGDDEAECEAAERGGVLDTGSHSGVERASGERRGEARRLRAGPAARPAERCEIGGVDFTTGDGRREERSLNGRCSAGDQAQGRATRSDSVGDGRSFWDSWTVLGPDPEGKCRRIEPGLVPMVTRLPIHVAQIRALGNAIVPPLAAEVVRAFMEAEGV